MTPTELTLEPGGWAATGEQLRELRRDADRAAEPLILAAAGGAVAGEDAPGAVARALAEVERLPAPVVLAAGGALDAAGLALCCACIATYLDPDTEVRPLDPAAALSEGLAGRLTERVGPAHAAELLLAAAGTPAVFSSGLALSSADPAAGARALADRLADPRARLLRRSLAFAARSSRRQSAEYDRELIALLDAVDVQ